MEKNIENDPSNWDILVSKREQSAALGTAATKVAGGLESASCYLQEKKFEHLGGRLQEPGSSLPSAISIDWSRFRVLARRARQSR
jgi:hypothetical protein